MSVATTIDADPARLPQGFLRVSQWLAERGHAHAPAFLQTPARTAQEAADLLGVRVGQIAKSVIFRRLSDEAAVLVVTSGDRRVDEARVARCVGPLGRADARFVKERTGYSIGGVAPVAHTTAPVTLIDRDLFRFDAIWAAAGHPNGVFRLAPAQLVDWTGAPVAEVVEPPATAVASPCINVCRMDERTGWCEGCTRTLDEIAAWGSLSDDARREVLARVDLRRR